MTDQHLVLAPELSGELSLPDHPRGLVLLQGGPGGRRADARLRAVAGYLRRRGLATLRLPRPGTGPGDDGDEREPAEFTPAEEAGVVATTAHQLVLALGGVGRHAPLAGLPVGVLGVGLGAAAALVVAAERPQAVRAVVSLSGRPDLAAASLHGVACPVLLAVGEFDAERVEVARDTVRELPEARLDIVPRATRLFEEAGALERVALAAADWFERRLRVPGGA